MGGGRGRKHRGKFQEKRIKKVERKLECEEKWKGGMVETERKLVVKKTDRRKVKKEEEGWEEPTLGAASPVRQ